MTHVARFTSHEVEQVRLTVRRVLRDQEDRRDAVQTALMHAWEHRAEYDGRVLFITWLCRVARNAAIDVLRSRGKHLAIADTVHHEAARTTPSPHGEVEAREGARLAVACMADAPAEQVEALRLRHVEGLKDDAIARRQGVPANTVRSRLRLARERMAKGVAR